ncbi:MAG: leucine-rich repeat protein [Bacteroides sp.]|nr:leucine-rich repeat protein [Bacteroides sp.]
MKRYFLLLLSLLVVISCHKFDDSDLWDKINNHEDRILKLETLCSQMNTNITSLQTIIVALQSNDYIVNVSPIKEGDKEIGYTIAFAKSGAITIYHGKDGKNGKDGKDGTDGKDGQNGYAPEIGVKQHSDGKYYWTLDGTWLLDNNGNMIPTTGKDGNDGANGTDGTDGTDGITPQLKIEDGYWLISYDKGTTWQKLGKATADNNQSNTDQNDGSYIIESITQDNKWVYIKLNDGTIITLSKTPSNHDIIQFEDRYVKAICISRWDTNNDGELSYDEAAAVDDIGNLFSNFWIEKGQVLSLGNSSILSFNELQYFTGLTNISGKSFYHNINLTNIILPETLTEISDGGYALLDCRFNETGELLYGAFAYSKIANIIIPDSVTSIGSYSFYNCNRLKYISIGKNVTYIGDNAFEGCTGKLNVNCKLVEDNYTKLPKWLEGTGFSEITFGENCTSIGNYLFSNYNSLKCINLPPSITAIGDYSFSGCTSLININLPSSIYSIGNYSFSGCTSLININIPDGIYSIGNYALSNCINMQDLIIPDSVISIGDYCFKNCKNMSSVTIGKEISSIGNGAFSGCTKLKSIYCKASTPPSVASFIDADQSMVIYVPKESVTKYRKVWRDYANKIVGYNFN